MSTVNRNLSLVKKADTTKPSAIKVGIVVSEWNDAITESLFKGAMKTLLDSGVKKTNIIRADVPGSFELTVGAQLLYTNRKVDAVICLGCVVQGETRHFEFICNAVADGLTNLSIKHNIPFVFGVLTTDNMQQALDRSGGKHGNKGVEAAVTALKMVELKKQLSKK